MTRVGSQRHRKKKFVALGIEHAMRMRHIGICCLPLLYGIFPHYLINGTILEKKTLKLKFVFRVSLQLLSETFLILRKPARYDYKKCICLHVKYPVF